MKKFLKLLSAAVSAVMIFSCCAKSVDESQNNSGNAAESSSAAVSVEFPSGTDEITEYNKHIFDINQFTTSFSLPAGWSVTDEASPEYSLLGTWSKRYFYSGDGKCVGAIGYNIIPKLSEEEMKIPAAVYNQIALGNDYQFAVRTRYDIVKSDNNSETALTDVYYSEVVTGDGEKVNKGILMLDRAMGVYVAAEFESTALTDEQHRQIAESMELAKSDSGEITDTEIKRLVEDSHFIRLMTEYDTLPFDQIEPSKWQDRDYYKVTDERFDEWNEWVEYVRTVYSENMEEKILTNARYININGFTFTDGLATGCDILFDRYTYEMSEPVDGRPVCNVKLPDAFDESGGSFFTETITFENTANGWRICDIANGYETAENADTSHFSSDFALERKYIDKVYNIYLAAEIVGSKAEDEWVNNVFLAQSPEEQEDPPPIYQMIRDLNISEEDFRKKNEEYIEYPDMCFSDEIIYALYQDETEMKKLLANPYALYYDNEIYTYDDLAENPFLAANIPAEVIDEYFDFLEDVCEEADLTKYMMSDLYRIRLQCKEANKT
ncbi:MAG: IseA DL-endopeptidase inhibitor family protein [Oscillospiraceae bacterium]|nr:IseA DL-endopeptidase inhibitor family protein [Oscillospiraceae bacterium]